MRWRKLGLVYSPTGDRRWARRNASFPTAELLAPGEVRVYFTALDDNNFGRGGYVDLDPDDLTRIVAVSEDPILDTGPIGDFDDAGVNPFTVVPFKGKRLMYFQGWQRTLRAPYAIFTGLAVQVGDGPFEKWGRTPVLERTREEPHIRGAPYTIAEGDSLTMWYAASSLWSYREEQLYYHVGIRHAVSTDGVCWTVSPGACLEPGPGEYGLGRPVVVRDGSNYRMWYSIRSFDRPYRMGYAESADGLTWTRKDDEIGIAASASGWDSEMLCYGYVLKIGTRLVMFYNGNQHGATGFGCAELEAF